MSEVKIGRVVIGMCATNTYFLYRKEDEIQSDNEYTDVIVIDPADQGKDLYDKLKEKGLIPKAILLTHAHFDHIWGIRGLVTAARKADAEASIPIYASELEVEVLADPSTNLSGEYGRPTQITPDVALADGEEFDLCGIHIKMISTPGHTPGGCCFYVEEAELLVSGDTLFQGSVGRTDFPGGSMSTLVRSINEKLMILPGKTKVYPGHGEGTTIEFEQKNNPFLCI